MNILILGNGFDIAHGLPTNYIDFLNICKYVNNSEVSFCNEEVFVISGILGEDEKNNLKEFATLLGCENYMEFKENSCNYWIKHFQDKRSQLGEGWLDFEDEIKKQLERIKHIENNSDNEIITKIVNVDRGTNQFIRDRLLIGKVYRELYKTLLEEHKKLIRTLELYMDTYISKKNCKKIKFFENEIFDYILSFNYTNTYNFVYSKNVSVCFIHGKASAKREKGKSNIVLGYEDYYIDNHSLIPDFIPFEKYYQRIVNGTDSDYLDLIERNNEREEYVVHIYGHSCATSDGDVLKKFITLNKAKTIVYCKDDFDRAEKIKNLAVVLEPDNLIIRTSGMNPTLVFKMIDEEM